MKKLIAALLYKMITLDEIYPNDSTRKWRSLLVILEEYLQVMNSEGGNYWKCKGCGNGNRPQEIICGWCGTLRQIKD